jgi:hypothetical protein
MHFWKVLADKESRRINNEEDTMTNINNISPPDAQEMVQRAEQISKRAHDAVRWPYITFLLALGLTTSFGSLAMALTTGRAFGLAYTGTLLALFGILMFFLVTTKNKRAFVWSKRWTIYISAWAVAYMGAIAVVGFMHGSLIWAAVTSGLVLAVTFIAAIIEVRR